MIRIFGVGNPLRQDDGVGIAVVERLWQETMPEEVEVIDAGAGGLDLVHLMAEADHVLLVDAVEMGEPPGTVRWLTPQDIRRAEEPSPLSLHQTRVGPMLYWLEMLGQPPPIAILGIQPARVGWGRGLDPAVEQAVTRAVTNVHEWLAHLESWPQRATGKRQPISR